MNHYTSGSTPILVPDKLTPKGQIFFQLLMHKRTMHLRSQVESMINKPINSWNGDDIFLWVGVLETTKVSLHFDEVLAVISRAIFITRGYYLRPAQLIAIILAYKANHGRLMQVATGEGKSIIFAVIAILKALENHAVDIVTSSPVLAQRDAQEQAKLFSVFGLSARDNIKFPGRTERERIECYEANIVYGDINNFIGDKLRQDYHKQNTRGARPYAIALVDEVDSMLIDNSQYVVKLSEDIPGFEHLEVLLVAVWNQLHAIKDELNDEGMYEFGDEQIQIDDVLLEQILAAFINELLESPDAGISVPTHLRKFVQRSAEKWSKSAVIASHYRENVNYVIRQDENLVWRIKPVDYHSTGVIQINMQWHNGLHQFLQIKHGLKISPESLAVVYMSNVGYFKLYGKNLIGMTGTLGARAEQNLLQRAYDVDFVEIPTYKKKRFMELPARVEHGEAPWFMAIKESVLREMQRGRAVLIIAQTILEAARIEDRLRIGLSLLNIKTYTQGSEEVAEEVVASGDVIVATNLAGRGTDLKTSQELERRGGLHVIVAYLPINLRVENQAFGRTSRPGKSGTAQLIINAETELRMLAHRAAWHKPSRDQSPIQILRQWRDIVEEERLRIDQLVNIEMMWLQDDMFTKFLAFTDYMRASKPSCTHEVAQVGEFFGAWHEQWESRISALSNFTQKINFKGNCSPIAK